MGAWGTKYNQSDDHYNFSHMVLEAGIEKLSSSMNNMENGHYADGDGDFGEPMEEFIAQIGRAMLITMVKALKGSELGSVSPSGFKILERSRERVLQAAERTKDNWVDPQEYMESVNAEMDEVDEYLNEFRTGSVDSMTARLADIMKEMG